MALAEDIPRGSSEPDRPSLGLVGEVLEYVGRAREFEREDWIVYVAWVGMMIGLVGSTAGFLLFGRSKGVSFPTEAWLVPVGAAIFSFAIAVDTIGHRTIYKQEIGKAEGLVHAVTIFFGIGSCICLCAAYENRAAFTVPAAVMTIMSFVYSLVDEVFHWFRYATKKSDRVEMSSHALIFLGHGIMMGAWWVYFLAGYPGVRETLASTASR